MALTVTDYVDVLRAENGALAGALAAHPIDEAVPTCPGWAERDLVRHLGGVHRWATGFVLGERHAFDTDLETVVGGWPPDPELAAWLSDGLVALADALETADPDLDAPTFLPAPTPLTFWARRQAHETTIHRLDAESPSGLVPTVGRELALDGMEEILLGFGARRGKLVRPDDAVVALVATDADGPEGRWRIRFGSEGGESTPGEGSADVTLRAPASVLYRWLWNRADGSELEISGDAALLGAWGDGVQVRWS